MARTLQTARLNHPAPVSNPTANPPTTSPRLHTDFMEVKVHTAKCDSCDKHNKLTLYRCTECGQHVCSLCWNKKLADGTHDFGANFRDVPELNANRVIEDDDADGEKEHGNEGRAHSRRRVHVISDDEDDDLAVLKPASTRENADANDASKQHKQKKNVIMNDNLREDHEDELPRLWPILLARRLPVLRPAVPAANTSVTESANRVTQRNPHIHEGDSDPEHQSIVRVYDDLGRQIIPSPYVFVGDQETNPQTCHPSQSSMTHQQVNRSAPLHAQPAIYRPRPGADLDQQAARNQYAFANSQPTNRQAPRPAQPLIAQQQATHLASRQIQPAVYRPRPGADLDKQAARNQLAFANRKRINHQAPQPGQASVSHQQGVHPAPHPAQTSISQQHAQTAANMDQVAARNQQAHRLNQQAEAYANAKQMNARNRQNLTSHQNTWPAANSDQLAAHYRQAFISNQLSSSGANCAEARDRHQAYLSRHQANRPTPPAQTLVLHSDATESSSFSAQASLSQEHAALLNSRQTQHPIATQGRPSGPSGGIQGREVCLPVPIS